MAQLNNVRRIIVEDYPEESRETVGKLAEVLNDFMVDVNTAFNGNIDNNNLRRELVTLDITLGSNNVPIGNDKIKSKLSYVYGSYIVNVQNLTNTSIYPTAAPFMYFTYLGSGLIQIKSIVGLQSGVKYRLNLELIG